MSYDIILGAGKYPAYETNYTSNIWRIWEAASNNGGNMRDLDGLTGAAAVPILAGVLVRLRGDRDRYRALEPANKWGTLDTFIPFLERLLDACRAHPRLRIRVSA